MAQKNKIIVFDFMDYREFLKRWYQEAKRTQRGFSYRAFSLRAGFGAPNFLKRIIDGERNLSTKTLPGFIKALGLNKQEQDFFKKLVLFNQAHSHEKKDVYYKQLISSQKYRKIKPVEKDQYEFYSRWYHPIVRELIITKNSEGTAAWIAKNISPAISEEDAQKSIDLLERLGFIQKNRRGKWIQADALTTTGAEPSSHVLMNYHQNILNLAKHQLQHIPQNQRDISALTLSLSKKHIPVLKKMVQEFRQDVLKLVADDKNPDEVALLAMQLFPVKKSHF